MSDKKASSLFEEFFNNEKATGIILILCTVVSILLVNSPAGSNYLSLWTTEIGIKIGSFHLQKPLEYWINEGLMALFFLMAGLEIEREIYIGELSGSRKAVLPVLAAIGGMAFPALFYFLFNAGKATIDGVGIPMATDIAFSLGILALVGSRVPVQLKIFLTALAIIDDLGAIIIIAVFYVHGFSLSYLLLALAVFVGMLVMNRLKVRLTWIYLVAGAFMWYFMLKSGVHATVTGVLTAFAIPFEKGKENSPSTRLQHNLHIPVMFFIVPLFALANTGILFSENIAGAITQPVSLGIIVGLVAGKPLGILLFSFIAVKSGMAVLPVNTTYRQILGVGLLAGIGFTMSIFITALAFTTPEFIYSAKLAIVVSSVIAGLLGYTMLKFSRR